MNCDLLFKAFSILEKHFSIQDTKNWLCDGGLAGKTPWLAQNECESEDIYLDLEMS